MSEQDADDGESAPDDVAGADDPAPETCDGDDVAESEAGRPAPGVVDEALRESVPEVQPTDDLVERVEEANPEAIAGELATLRDRVADLEEELEARAEAVDDLESRLARKQADFQNYKQRQADRMEEEKRRATEDLVERLLDVRDNLQRALDQDEDADIRGGVESTLGQFDAELERENVESIEPESGDDVDPQRHEVLMRVESDLPEDAVADVHRPGYEMAGKVLRPAQVTVSEGPDEADGDRDGGDGEGGGTGE